VNARVVAMVAGFVFLYAPIAWVVAYSFNASRLVTVWGGFSTTWYRQLLDNDALLSAAWLSLRVAAVNATLATLLGTAAALLLARVARGVLRTFVAAGVAALLVVPEVILGFGLLLTFVTLEQWLHGALPWPAGRGADTITIAHATLSLAYVTVVVRARLARLDPAVEDAARDLGATPLAVLATVTLPLLAPALAAGWLLAFTLSLDDLVIASFVSGPGSTTLPMAVYSSVRLGVSPEINALATLLIACVAVGVGMATWVMTRGGASAARR
jgi:putrescine transport system permease protein